MEKVGRRLEQAMAARDMTAAELSRKTGISKSSLSRYMSGDYNPNNEKLEKLSRALNVNEAWLLGYDEVDMERESDEIRQEKSLTLDGRDDAAEDFRPLSDIILPAAGRSVRNCEKNGGRK